MTQSLAAALPRAIAKVSELIGEQSQQAKQLDEAGPGSGDGCRMIAAILRNKRDVALEAIESGSIVAMMLAYEAMKPALELAESSSDSTTP